MITLVCILCFLNGACLTACFFITLSRRKKDNAQVEQDKDVLRIAKQYENFMTYSGSGKGQREIDAD